MIATLPVFVFVCAALWVSLSVPLQDRRHHAMSLVSEAERLQQRGISYPETEAFRDFVCTFKSGLEDFLCRAEACGRELQIMVNVCDFCEQVCIWYLSLVALILHVLPVWEPQTFILFILYFAFFNIWLSRLELLVFLKSSKKSFSFTFI